MATKKKDATTEGLLNGMLADYQSRGGYVPKTTAENKARAQDEYKSYYDQLRLNAQQQQQQADLALQQQRAGLQDTYDRQREASAKEYRQRLSQADQHMLSRGMQRSSYGAQIRANIGQQGAEAQQRLWDAQGVAEGNIDAQRAQLAQQLGAQLRQYDASRAADVLKRTRELDDQEYERQQADQARRDQTGMQLASILRQAERDKISDAQFEKQFGLSKQQAEAQLANMRWQQQYQEGRARASDEQWAKQYGLNERQLEAQLANQQWQQQRQTERDRVADTQWQQNYDMSREKLAADLAAQQWQQARQEARDKVSDEQFERQFGLTKAQFDAQMANQAWQQQRTESQDRLAAEQWAKQFGLSEQQLAAQLAQQQWQRDYQAARDKVADAQWQKNYDMTAQKWADTLAEQMYQRQYQEARDAVKDSQWQKEFQYKVNPSSFLGSTNPSSSQGSSAAQQITPPNGDYSIYTGPEYEDATPMYGSNSYYDSWNATSKKSSKYSASASNTGRGYSTADLINELSQPAAAPAATGQSILVNQLSQPSASKVNVKTQPAQVTEVAGPVNPAFLAGLNKLGASENKVFESQLENALKNKKK